MRLLCCEKAHAGLVNGVVYTVERVDKKLVVYIGPAYLRDRRAFDALDERAREIAGGGWVDSSDSAQVNLSLTLDAVLPDDWKQRLPRLFR